MTTAIATTTLHDGHDDEQHVEQAGRLHAIHAAIDRSGIRPELLALPQRLATVAELERAHHPQMISFVRDAAAQGGGWVDRDTYVTADSWDAARAAAGAALAAVDAVLAGETDNAFALIRPPGHHATGSRPMGFCLVNNIAVAAKHALAAGVRRVAIVDFDVHHGNGTQDIFYEEPRVLFASSHGGQIFPGTGAADEHGAGAGTGLTINAPLPFGVSDAGIQLLYGQAILPAVRAFQPELLLVSAGYDAHWPTRSGRSRSQTPGSAGWRRSCSRLRRRSAAARRSSCLRAATMSTRSGAAWC